MAIKVEVKHENQNTREYGYGLYVNGYVTDTELETDGLYASECINRNATPEEIKAAERRVRQNARNAYLRDMGR